MKPKKNSKKKTAKKKPTKKKVAKKKAAKKEAHPVELARGDSGHLGDTVSRNVVSLKPVVDSSDPSTWPDHITEKYIYGGKRNAAAKPKASGKPIDIVNKSKIIEEKKAIQAKKEAASGNPRMGLCPDKKLFTKVLKEEISLNVAKEGVKVTLKSRLKEDLDLDSLEAIEMLLDLEDKYGVEIDNTLMDFNRIQTVGHLRDFLFDKTLFPEDIVKRDKERAKQYKVDTESKKKREIEHKQFFQDEYSQGEYEGYNDGGITAPIDVEEEFRKIDEEEGVASFPLPSGGKQIQ